MAADGDERPSWSYFPRNIRPPAWATDLVAAVREAREAVDTTEERVGLRSDVVLGALAGPLGPLGRLGYEVETGKAVSQRIRRPVLFGENGVSSLTYEVDAVHDALGVGVEVEAGRGAQSNADYRDLVRASLIPRRQVPGDAHARLLPVPVKGPGADGGGLP